MLQDMKTSVDTSPYSTDTQFANLRRFLREEGDGIILTKSDKTNRMVALSKHNYDDMLTLATLDSGNFRPQRTTKPLTEQAKFNKKLTSIATNYKLTDTTLHIHLMRCTCSEPMPCGVYCLPKDHKEGL